jgi:hypothetical protein
MLVVTISIAGVFGTDLTHFLGITLEKRLTGTITMFLPGPLRVLIDIPG